MVADESFGGVVVGRVGKSDIRCTLPMPAVSHVRTGVLLTGACAAVDRPGSVVFGAAAVLPCDEPSATAADPAPSRRGARTRRASQPSGDGGTNSIGMTVSSLRRARPPPAWQSACESRSNPRAEAGPQISGWLHRPSGNQIALLPGRDARPGQTENHHGIDRQLTRAEDGSTRDCAIGSQRRCGDLGRCAFCVRPGHRALRAWPLAAGVRGAGAARRRWQSRGCAHRHADDDTGSAAVRPDFPASPAQCQRWHVVASRVYTAEPKRE